jgi:hypothetical protein
MLKKPTPNLCEHEMVDTLHSRPRSDAPADDPPKDHDGKAIAAGLYGAADGEDESAETDGLLPPNHVAQLAREERRDWSRMSPPTSRRLDSTH